MIQDSVSGAVIYQDPMEHETVVGLVDAIVRHGLPAIVYESPANGGRVYAVPNGAVNLMVELTDYISGFDFEDGNTSTTSNTQHDLFFKAGLSIGFGSRR